MVDRIMPAEEWWREHKVSLPPGQRGRWAIEHFKVEAGTRLSYFRVYGQDCPPGTYTRLVYYKDGPPEIAETLDDMENPAGQSFMTDTPGEIEDHGEVMAEIRRRGGRVLIHGLGLGLIARFALDQPNVSHVDVVELDQDVIDLVAPHYRDERLTIHRGDARTYEWPVGSRWSVVWHDIWGDYRVENLEEMASLRRRFAAMADWQASWSEEFLIGLRRAERRRLERGD